MHAPSLHWTHSSCGDPFSSQPQSRRSDPLTQKHKELGLGEQTELVAGSQWKTNSVDAAPACVMYYPHLHSVQVLSRPNPQQGALSGGVQDKLCEDAPGRCKTALHLPQEGAQGCCRGCPVVFC